MRAAWFPLTPTADERLETMRRTSFQTTASRPGTLPALEEEEEEEPVDEAVVRSRRFRQQTMQSDSEWKINSLVESASLLVLSESLFSFPEEGVESEAAVEERPI